MHAQEHARPRCMRATPTPEICAPTPTLSAILRATHNRAHHSRTGPPRPGLVSPFVSCPGPCQHVQVSTDISPVQIPRYRHKSALVCAACSRPNRFNATGSRDQHESRCWSTRKHSFVWASTRKPSRGFRVEAARCLDAATIVGREMPRPLQAVCTALQRVALGWPLYMGSLCRQRVHPCGTRVT